MDNNHWDYPLYVTTVTTRVLNKNISKVKKKFNLYL